MWFDFCLQVGCACVSLEGDSFSPYGLLCGGGGFSEKKKMLLPVLEKSREVRHALEGKQKELKELEHHTQQTKQVR